MSTKKTSGKIELRPYQLESIDALRQGLRRGHRRQILCAPTGSGKTHIAGRLISDAVADRGSKCVFVADRIVLVHQTSQRFYDLGIQHGVVQGGNTFGAYHDVQVCSIQTLLARKRVPQCDFVIIDEAHTMYRGGLDFLRNMDVPVIGLTATPFTKGLGDFYSNVVNVVTTNDLLNEIDPSTDAPFLAPLRPYAAVEIDMTGAKTNNAGEWSDATVSERVSRVVGDVPSTWVERTQQVFGYAPKTLVFSATVDDGALLVRAFQNAGYDFRQSTYRDDAERTTRMVNEFARGRFTGLVSVDKFTKGFDVPDVECIVIARPYRKSLSKVIQILGRGMRSSPGKEFCLVLDHGGNMRGFQTQIADFYANGCNELERNIDVVRRKVTPTERKQSECKCGFIFVDPTLLNCPSCGADKPRRVAATEAAAAGTMVSVDLAQKTGDRQEWRHDERWTWAHLCATARELKRRELDDPDDDGRVYKLAGAQFRTMYGYWPKLKYDRTVVESDRRVYWTAVRQLESYRKSKTS